MTTAPRIFSVLLTIGFLSACVGHDLKKLEYAGMAGDSYYDVLARTYRQMALDEKAKNDWSQSRLFAQKALQADHGIRVDPEQPQQWNVNPDALEDLVAARNELMDTITTQAIDQYPLEAATAVTSFDCWVEQSSNYEKEVETTCEPVFFEALNALSVALDPTAPRRSVTETPEAPASMSYHAAGLEAPVTIDASAAPYSRGPAVMGGDLRRPLSMQMQPLAERPSTPVPPASTAHTEPAAKPAPKAVSKAKPAKKQPKAIAPKAGKKAPHAATPAPKHPAKKAGKPVAKPAMTKTLKVAPPTPKAAPRIAKPAHPKAEPVPNTSLDIPAKPMTEVPTPQPVQTAKPVDGAEKTKLPENAIYFAPDMVAINEDGADLLKKIVDSLPTTPNTIIIHGHTDRAEGGKDRMKFSIRRANAVRDALVGMGVDPNTIKVFGFGDSDLLRPTEPDVADPLNRRVEITVE